MLQTYGERREGRGYGSTLSLAPDVLSSPVLGMDLWYAQVSRLANGARWLLGGARRLGKLPAPP